MAPCPNRSLRLTNRFWHLGICLVKSLIPLIEHRQSRQSVTVPVIKKNTDIKIWNLTILFYIFDLYLNKIYCLYIVIQHTTMLFVWARLLKTTSTKFAWSNHRCNCTRRHLDCNWITMKSFIPYAFTPTRPSIKNNNRGQQQQQQQQTMGNTRCAPIETTRGYVRRIYSYIAHHSSHNTITTPKQDEPRRTSNSYLTI